MRVEAPSFLFAYDFPVFTCKISPTNIMMWLMQHNDNIDITYRTYIYIFGGNNDKDNVKLMPLHLAYCAERSTTTTQRQKSNNQHARFACGHSQWTLMWTHLSYTRPSCAKEQRGPYSVVHDAMRCDKGGKWRGRRWGDSVLAGSLAKPSGHMTLSAYGKLRKPQRSDHAVR